MDDLRAVLDAVASDRAILFGSSQAAPMVLLFGAMHPDRTLGLILWAPVAKAAWSPDYPWGETLTELETSLEELPNRWGSEGLAREAAREIDPALAGDDRYVRYFARLMRHSASPTAAATFERMTWDTDVRHILPAVRVPTLVIDGDQPSARESRWIAEQIPDAAYRELSGVFLPYVNAAEQDLLLVELKRFVDQLWTEEARELSRVLATVMFTDIVASTERVVDLGDRGWKELLESHHTLVRAFLSRHRGREIDTAGDGFFASFDGPARAVRCAAAIVKSVRDLGIEVRVGVHTAECEIIAGKLGGAAVHACARMASVARPSEILVSHTVKDLTAGSGLVFEDAGEHELKGVPDRWHLYRVVGEGA